ncbi:MAG: MBL fold metallo-hydrolase [Fermentimonas sp.]|nr:MBL fold metallo-hydrolase [Fermentimonas sp.]
MTVTYIYHSCYLIEFDEFSVLFDFYEDSLREDGTYWITDYLLNKEEDLYVFCSHSHSDHFNQDILSWRKNKTNIRYIFSFELLQSNCADVDAAVYLKKEDYFKDHRIKVKAFGSTDIGCSFLIGYNDQLFFHAGDLNNWHWRDEVSAEEALTYENNFLCELELISERSDNLYLAMFPIDPRLGKDFIRGAEQFISRIQTEYLVPMHFGENYDKVNQFEAIAAESGCTYLPITNRGQSFKL